MKAHKTIFPLWTLERILKEAVDNLNVYWIEPVGSFDLENSSDLQLDMPITLKDFLFHSFDKIANVSTADKGVDQALCSFYLKHMRPQYKTWSSKKITTVKVYGPIETKSFIDARFKVARGVVSSTHEFTLADMPCLNPFDGISMLLLLMKDQQKFEPIITHLKQMLDC